MSSWDNEKPPMNKVLLPEGWRAFKIVYGEETVSKAGNHMFKITLEDIDLQQSTTIYLIRTPGKRWQLKQVLEALNVEKLDDDMHNYIPEILEKSILGKVVHEPNNWIDREGNNREDKQHKIVEFKAYNVNPDGATDPKNVSWEE